MARRPKKVARGEASSRPPTDRARTPGIALTVAVLLALGCVAHLLLAERAYPANLPTHWLFAGGTILFGSVIVARLSGRWGVEFPRRALNVLLKPAPGVFATGLAVLACAGSIAFAYYAFDRLPTTADEMAQLWHARMLLHGHVSLPVDPNPEFFAIDNMIDDGRWYSEYPIGGPAVLAVGLLLGAPWIINPLLCGATAVAMYQFSRRVYSEGEARAVGVLFCLSPMALMMAGSHMNHVPVLFFAVCTLVALAEWDSPQSPRRAAFAAGAIGFFVGAMATIRPLDAVVVALCVGVFQIVVIARNRKRLRELPLQIGCGLAAIAPLLYANWRTTGAPFRFGYEVLWGAAHGLGLHVDPLGTEHTLRRAAEYATSYVSALNFFALMWPVPVLAVVFVALLTMKRFARWDALLLGLFAAQVIAYGLYWHNGQFIGPRFLYTALPSILIIVARAPFLIGDRLGAIWRRGVVAFVFACTLFAWTATSPRFSVWGMARVYHDTRIALKIDVARIANEAGLRNALVFLRETFRVRLLHRMWGIGIPRSEAAILLDKSDACSLFEAVRVAERDTSHDRATRLETVRRTTLVYVESDSAVRGKDGLVRLVSRSSATPACVAELADDERRGGAPFGPALPHEPIGADGRVDGDVIFVADLGERNELLRARFGTRTWYRLTVVRPGDKSGTPRIEPY